MTELVQNTITCPRCSSPLPADVFNVFSDGACPHCRLVITGRLFPRFFKPFEGMEMDTGSSPDNESSCFFHPGKRAVSHCVECGRFLCSLCELNIEEKIICPTCLEKLDSEKKIRTFTNQVTFYDSIALSIAIIPMILWPFTIMTAPLTLIYIVRHFKDPANYVVPRGRWRFYLAGLIALMQVTGWMLFIMIIVLKLSRS